MGHWWDEDAGKYRFSLTHRVLNVWLWPIERWCMQNLMSEEQAHWFAIHVAIPVVHRINQIEMWIRAGIIIPIVIFLYLLSFLPGCSWRPPVDKQPEQQPEQQHPDKGPINLQRWD